MSKAPAKVSTGNQAGNKAAPQPEDCVAPASQSPSGIALAKAGRSLRQVNVNLSDIYFTRDLNIRDHASYEDLSTLEVSIERTGGLLDAIEITSINPRRNPDGSKNADKDSPGYKDLPYLDPASAEATDYKEYLLLDGFRRCFCLEEISKRDPSFSTNIPATVVKMDSPATMKVVQLISGVQRKNLTPMEIARGIQEAMSDKSQNLKQGDIAGMIGLSEGIVSQYMKLLNLPQEVQEMISKKEISFSHARTLMYSVPQSKWKDFAVTAKKMTIGEFDKHVEQHCGKADEEAMDGTSAEGSTAGTDGSTTKRPVMLRSSVIKNTYIPFLEERVKVADGAQKVYTGKDVAAALLDAMKTVLQQETQLSKDVEPFKKKQEELEAAAEVAETADEAREKFLKAKVKEAKALYDADPLPGHEDEPRPTMAACYGAVKSNTVQSLLVTDENGKPKVDANGQGSYDPEKVKALGFSLNLDTFTDDLSKTYGKMVKDAEENRVKREKAKAEAKAKEDAEAAAKLTGAGTASTVAPATEATAPAVAG